MADPFEKFAERARAAMSLAHEEALGLQHNYIGTEHLLLGLIHEGDGIAAQVLASFGFDLKKVRANVAAIIGRGDRLVMGNISLTPRAKKVLQLAVDEARQLKHDQVDTEHLLLGLIDEGQGIAAGILTKTGVGLHDVRQRVMDKLRPGSGNAA